MRVVDEAKTIESLKRVSENVTKVYQSGFAHGFAEIEKVVMDDVEVGLDNIIAIQEELIGTITFYFEDIALNLQATCTALNGMTWAEWCNSKYNPGYAYIDDDGYVCAPSNHEYVLDGESEYVERSENVIVPDHFYHN